MKYFDEKNHANNLPDYYAKSITSNNYKLLKSEKISVDSLSKDISDLFEMLEIDNAIGATLDKYGEMVGQPRGVATDAQYRYMISASFSLYGTKRCLYFLVTRRIIRFL